MTDFHYKYHKYPSWCCQRCGEPIGWLGRGFQIVGVSFHTCVKPKKQ